MRAALADGWGGSMMGTDISDILFGTPKPVRTNASLDVFMEDHVTHMVADHCICIHCCIIKELLTFFYSS